MKKAIIISLMIFNIGNAAPLKEVIPICLINSSYINFKFIEELEPRQKNLFSSLLGTKSNKLPKTVCKDKNIEKIETLFDSKINQFIELLNIKTSFLLDDKKFKKSKITDCDQFNELLENYEDNISESKSDKLDQLDEQISSSEDEIETFSWFKQTYIDYQVNKELYPQKPKKITSKQYADYLADKDGSFKEILENIVVNNAIDANYRDIVSLKNTLKLNNIVIDYTEPFSCGLSQEVKNYKKYMNTKIKDISNENTDVAFSIITGYLLKQIPNRKGTVTESYTNSDNSFLQGNGKINTIKGSGKKIRKYLGLNCKSGKGVKITFKAVVSPIDFFGTKLTAYNGKENIYEIEVLNDDGVKDPIFKYGVYNAGDILYKRYTLADFAGNLKNNVNLQGKSIEELLIIGAEFSIEIIKLTKINVHSCDSIYTPYGTLEQNVKSSLGRVIWRKTK